MQQGSKVVGDHWHAQLDKQRKLGSWEQDAGDKKNMRPERFRTPNLLIWSQALLPLRT